MLCVENTCPPLTLTLTLTLRVIWSKSTNILVWIELTSPWEDDVALRYSEKHPRYTQLKIGCEANGWKVHALCVEAGCGGHVSQSFEWMCQVIGLTKEERKKLKYEVETTALHCSPAIVAARYQKESIPKPLLDVSKWS